MPAEVVSMPAAVVSMPAEVVSMLAEVVYACRGGECACMCVQGLGGEYGCERFQQCQSVEALCSGGSADQTVSTHNYSQCICSSL